MNAYRVTVVDNDDDDDDNDDDDDDDDDDELLMLTSEYRCAIKCYVLFVEVATRHGTDVVLTDHCKSKVTLEYTLSLPVTRDTGTRSRRVPSPLPPQKVNGELMALRYFFLIFKVRYPQEVKMPGCFF